MNSALPIGTVLAGSISHYQIKRVLGQGGFGITYLATDSHGNPHAIKEFFLKDYCERVPGQTEVFYSTAIADIVERQRMAFGSEAKRLMGLPVGQPGLVHVTDVFMANNTEYFVMDYVAGVSLKEYVTQRGYLDAQQTISIMYQVLQAVSFLHANRITHLDIKPANIMIHTTTWGQVIPVLIDFGLSKHYTDSGEATSVLASGGFTPGYAPLEQYAGITTFSPWVDVYSLAATTLFCLTGRTPSAASELTSDEINESARALPPNWRNVIIKSLEINPKSRPQDAAQVLNLISTTEKETTTQARPATKPKESRTNVRPARSKSNSRIMQIITIVAVALVGIGAGVYLYLDNNHSSPTSTAQEQDTYQESHEIPRVMSGQLGEDYNASITLDGEVGRLSYLNYQRDLRVDYYNRDSGQLIINAYQVGDGQYIGRFDGTLEYSGTQARYEGTFTNKNDFSIQFSFTGE